ncbi:MAG TPA: hypothetical protein VGR00_04270 [Thermoanaerobaculia bacterium]|jgi:hypothetical protein|nr:hypothetical protein [Thermoanaerobaculia bacterium]
MNVTRKEFLTTVAAGAAGAAVLSPHDVFAATSATTTAAQFKSAVGRSFRASGPSGRDADLVLKSYVEKPDTKTIQFTLVFESPDGIRLSEGTYRISGGSMSPSSMFLVPTGGLGGRYTYRADFNLLK